MILKVIRRLSTELSTKDILCMFALTNKPEMGARLYSALISMATDADKGVDIMKAIQHIAGVMVEMSLVFDDPAQSMYASFGKLSRFLDCAPQEGDLAPHALPPANIIDYETERGRAMAREFFEEWLDCAFEFEALFVSLLQSVIAGWEQDGLPRAETLRLLIECATRCMGFEIAAQELCDTVIDEKIGSEGWTLADCVAALSAVAGRRLGESLNAETCDIFRGADLPEHLDQIVHVMTQEAVRLGVPAGSNWRFGLAANDMPVNAPYELIVGIEPYCRKFFKSIRFHSLYDQAVSCAKAAGRMLAVASGGEAPEMEPAIAKPLAMAAITETYKSVCLRHRIAAF